MNFITTKIANRRYEYNWSGRNSQKMSLFINYNNDGCAGNIKDIFRYFRYLMNQN